MNQLACYATSEANSRGRQHFETAPNYRSEFQRDRDRIVHSTAFRRLEYKTQVFVNHEGDLFRTRLTHSIEVAQISRGIARVLHLNEDLTEAISLAHDLGHTPFGHAGQTALNQCMKQYGGFEHNYQSLRIIDLLEEKYAKFDGLNLMFETREGVLKHCTLSRAQQLDELGERFINKHQPSLEAQLSNLADEIAYNNHDIDDGLRAQLLTFEQLREVTLFREQHDKILPRYPKLDNRRMTHEIIRRMISRLVTDLIETSTNNLQQAQPQTIEDIRTASQPMIQFSSAMYQLNTELKLFLRQNLYHHYRVYRMNKKAQHIIRALFNAFFDDTNLLPSEHATKAMQAGIDDDQYHKARCVSDYIAGMTDRYAIREYNKLFDPVQLT